MTEELNGVHLGDRRMNGTISDELLDRRMSYIQRWHVHPTIMKENLAEHQWYVGYYAWVIARFLWSEGWPNIDAERAVMIGMLHDVPEVVTGDVPASFKRIRPDASTQIKEWEHDAEPLLFTGLPPAVRGEAVSFVYAPDCIEKQIVKIADRLHAWAYAEDEARTGNRHFDIICETIAGDILAQARTWEWWDYFLRRELSLLERLEARSGAKLG